MPGGSKQSRTPPPIARPFSAYFDELLNSPHFQASQRRNELLRYLVGKSLSGQAKTLSEYAIALDVFKKPESFDQRIDSTIRSEVSRLRKFIAAYYDGPGARDPWRIVFPARGYVPGIVEMQSTPPAPAQNPWRRRRGSLLFLCAALAVIVIIAGFVSWQRRGSNPPALLAHGAPSSHAGSRQAQAFYLKGQYFWEHRTEGSLRDAVAAYTQAIVADSDYAQAYAGLAASYDLMPEYAEMSQQEAFSRAIAAANKAISLDPSISIAHRALAFGLFWSQTDVPRAYSEFQEAIRLAPNDAEAHHWYATALNSALRSAEARKEIDIAQQLAPASRSILADQAWIRFWSGDPQAVNTLQDLEAAEPDFKSPPQLLARIYLAQRDYRAYLEQLHILATMSRNPADLEFSQAAQNGWSRGGGTGMLYAMQAVEEKNFNANQSDGYNLAYTCALLGEKQLAVKYLQSAFAARDVFVLDVLRPGWAPSLNGYPAFESIRAQIRTRMGIGLG